MRTVKLKTAETIHAVKSFDEVNFITICGIISCHDFSIWDVGDVTCKRCLYSLEKRKKLKDFRIL